MKGGSPFRLLQDYASDDSSGKDIKSLSSGTESQSRTVEKVFSEPSDGSLSNKAVGLDPTRGDEESGTTFITSGGTNRRIHSKNEDDTLINPAETFRKEDDLRGGGVDDLSENDKVQKGNEEENASSAQVPYKVDEFGRYLRQGASDSDSDDSRYGKRKKRDRSYSRSRSPAGRRRSPWKRRREKRSHSRSWSPRSRRSRRRRSKSRSRSRSRSRSPTFRQFSGANKRWGKGQSQVCFNFLRGKCHRGASCLYLHNDSDNSDRSRQLGNKQNLQVSPPGSKIPEVSVQDDEKVNRHEKEHHHDMQNDESFLHTKEDCSRDTLHPRQKAQSPNSTASGVAAEARMIHEEPEELNSQEVVESHQPDSFPSQSVSDIDVPKSLDDTYIDVPALDSAIKPPVTEPSSIVVCSSQAYLSSTSMSQHHLSGQSLTCKESSPLRSAAEIQHHHSHLQLPPPPPLIQGGNTPHVPLTSSMPLQYPSQLHLLPPPPPPPQLSPAGNISHMRHTPFIPSQSAPRECFRPYMFPYQQSNFTVPPTSSWNSLPLPPPPPPPPRPPRDAIVSSGNATPGAASQPQQSNLPPRNDSEPFLRTHSTQLPIRSLVNEFQHQAYPPMQEHYHALSHAGDFRLSTLPAVNPLSHAQRPVQYSSVNNSFPMGMHLQPRTDLRELPATKVQPRTGDNLLPSELLESSSQVHPYSQQQQRHASTDSFLDLPDNISSSRYPPIPPDVNKPSHLPDIGGSRIPTYYNPYASTFEQPLGSKLSSNDFRQENSSGLSNPSLNQQGLDSFQSTKTSSLPTSARASGHVFPIEGKDQYDPLFDCIEPSSSSFKKSDHFQTTNDSSILRLSGSNMPLDVGGNNKKEVGTVDITMSVDNDECGETGDAEVGVVENESPSDPIDSTDMNAGEVEIDQVKSSGKSKKSKDSRSMRVFKVALADFVKEILKPSWRQGNMSKEAFKTIVKKTVEKVSKAMKKHQIPKTQPKIDQYIDSSQRKLTKLVMGYVDKYVKG